MADYEWLFLSWFSNLIERLARIQHYVRQVAATAPGYEQGMTHLVLDLNESIEKLALRTYEHTCTFLEDANKTENRITYYSNLREIGQEFCSLHQRLGALPSPWAPRELDSFVQYILEEAGRGQVVETASATNGRRPPWTVVLSGYYNFSHAVVPALTERSYRDEFELGLELGGYPNILRIPKVEKDNPLMWPALIHELGHAIARTEGILDEAMKPPEIAQGTFIARMAVKPWVDEVIADLFATDLVGPAYLISFLSFADFWDLNLQKPSKSHPPPVARLDYMVQRLSTKNGLSLSSLPGLRKLMEREHDARLTLDFADIQERHSLFDELERAKRAEAPYLERGAVAQLAERISPLESFKAIEAIPFTMARWTLVEELAGQLAEDIPISSRGLAQPYRAALGGKTSGDQLEELSHALREVPNSVADIVSAGTLRRLGLAPVKPGIPKTEFAQRIASEFCDSKYSNVSDRLTAVLLDVTAFDLLVSKSIETAAVMKFYVKGTASE